MISLTTQNCPFNSQDTCKLDTECLNPDEKSFFNQVSLLYEKSAETESLTRDQMDSDLWWKAQEKKLTAS